MTFRLRCVDGKWSIEGHMVMPNGQSEPCPANAVEAQIFSLLDQNCGTVGAVCASSDACGTCSVTCGDKGAWEATNANVCTDTTPGC